MPAKDIVSTALLFLGVVIGPAVFLFTIVGYGISRMLSIAAEYREQRYLRSLPCSTCRYFANNEFLPCAINPQQALTAAARDCNDFLPDECLQPTNGFSSYLRTLMNPEMKLKSPPKCLKE
ncbi:MAG: hypothetical protein AAGB19_16120 [Cyanobacteria bacterium P01_F01_bin.3]